ncbi:protein of unknown function (DUF3449) [Carpediemonas membranifera]|uniref:C2H2-type domain-containing protein n=1 Tax=Carpediemonas membranifera TaxID=201153 RepID=A0A8J6E656_9EUKA|nr:protein of unknown function (DUF3449) [Carpediemonas membranifera]|eukprot:KAG9396697.1 protein of unknown function (DUF3449) [Carpediemonas membranifera]
MPISAQEIAKLFDARNACEAYDLLEVAVAEMIAEKPSLPAEIANQQHRVALLCDKAISQRKDLETDYSPDEIQRIAKKLELSGSVDQQWATYSAGLKVIDASFPDTALEAMTLKPAPVDDNAPVLDLHDLHQRFTQVGGRLARGSAGNATVTYKEYLVRLDELVPPVGAVSQAMLNYLEDLLARLTQFDLVARPFNEPTKVDDGTAEMAKLQADREAMTQDGDQPPLFCSFCRKTFASHPQAASHYSGKAHKKRAQGEIPQLVTEEDRNVIRLTAGIRSLRKNLNESFDAIISDIDRRQGLSAAELELDSLIESAQAQPTEKKPTVRKIRQGSKTQQVMVGPDNQPVPYWIWKAQGLHEEFPCEICGGHVFQGLAAFEQHFPERRHASGLAKLGIAYSPAFDGVRTIEAAKKLWASLQAQEAARFDPRRDAEVLTKDGVVVTRAQLDKQKQRAKLGGQ